MGSWGVLTSNVQLDDERLTEPGWTYGIVEPTPLGVDDHLSTTGLESLVFELGQLAQILDVSSVGSGSKYCTK